MDKKANIPVPEPVRRDAVPKRSAAFKEHADTWLENNVHRFDPSLGEIPEKREIRRKAFTEAALYLHVAEMQGDVTTPQLKELLVSRTNDESFYSLLVRTPTELNKIGYPLVYLAEIDELDRDAQRVLNDVLEWPETWATSLPPSRQLDLWHICRMYGYTDHPLDFRRLLDQGNVNRYLSPARVGQNDAFGLTHELLYYHNLGSGSDKFPDEPLAYDYPSVLQGLLLRFIAEGHTDLVAELLLCGVLQRQLPPGFVRFVLGWILDHVDDDGYLSFPVDSPEKLKRFVGYDPADWQNQNETWRCYYHPTIVGGLLARALTDAWPELDTEANRRPIDYRSQAENLVKLGDVFALFANYSLEQGATYLRELSETPVVEEYGDVVAHAVRFLETQRRSDGTFGCWTDEQRLFTSKHESNTEADFREELLQPVSETCESAIEAVRSDLDGAIDDGPELA